MALPAYRNLLRSISIAFQGLRIHDDIERGNNDTIKAASNSLADTTVSGGCCGGPVTPSGGR
ncbi:MAG: hypothetical protein Q9194_004244 [Teloschistes cf. exilis]